MNHFTANLEDALWNAGIKNPEMYLRSRRPMVYDWLRGAFPRDILPTDADGEVEINGHFLRMEFKHEDALREGRIPVGQRRLLDALIDIGKFTVLLIGHDDRHEPTCVETWYYTGAKLPLKATDAKGIFQLCRTWARHIENTFPKPCK